MDKINEIFTEVVQVIEDSIGTPKEDIKLESTLFEELEVDSIDMIDILYDLESKYDVTLKVSDIELKAKEELGETPFDVDGVITKEGLDVLKKHMTEIDQNELTEGLTVHKLVQLFTVHSLCKIVLYKIENKDN